jgi:hypothetical protein
VHSPLGRNSVRHDPGFESELARPELQVGGVGDLDLRARKAVEVGARGEAAFGAEDDVAEEVANQALA